MDYEKAYKEALELARDYFKANQKIGESEENDMLSDIFPELKESEDERVRKNCIHFLELQKSHHASTVEIEECIDWLEKLGEQKPCCQRDECLDCQFNYAGECKGYCVIPKAESQRMISAEAKEALLYNNPSWSEGDERHKNTIIHAIHGAGNITPIDGELAEKWLKSLKDRVQPKKEWSEEDDRMYNRIISFIPLHLTAESYTACIDWLKSLRLQNTWKLGDLPHWKKSTLPDDDTTGFNSDYFSHKGYNINYKELFEKLPKDD